MWRGTIPSVNVGPGARLTKGLPKTPVENRHSGPRTAPGRRFSASRYPKGRVNGNGHYRQNADDKVAICNYMVFILSEVNYFSPSQSKIR
jgi:hypothetical protein